MFHDEMLFETADRLCMCSCQRSIYEYPCVESMKPEKLFKENKKWIDEYRSHQWFFFSSNFCVWSIFQLMGWGFWRNICVSYNNAWCLMENIWHKTYKIECWLPRTDLIYKFFSIYSFFWGLLFQVGIRTFYL